MDFSSNCQTLSFMAYDRPAMPGAVRPATYLDIFCADLASSPIVAWVASLAIGLALGLLAARGSGHTVAHLPGLCLAYGASLAHEGALCAAGLALSARGWSGRLAWALLGAPCALGRRLARRLARRFPALAALGPLLPTSPHVGHAHLASELEAFLAGRGRVFALTFLLLSFSARALLVLVLAGLF